MVEAPAFEEIKIEENGQDSAFTNEVLKDFWICCVSREASLLGRKEVLTGKAKFGILGDGKEVAQVAMARAFQKGDFRAGYYRDQTLMFALGLATVEDFFAQLYADPENDPFTGGRQMNSHFATPLIDEDGEWLNHLDQYNISGDVSPTGGQMARSFGLAFASKMYRETDPTGAEQFSRNGNEVCFCTIGDSSTSEGIFWETVNASGVHQVPLAISVWDDGYGISVPKELQTTKNSISEVLQGFQTEDQVEGVDIYAAKGWDYPGLVELYEKGIKRLRKQHIPAVFHIEEMTQPQGHSTSGSHERYKSEERLEWEEAKDCIRLMGHWMVENNIATENKIEDIRSRAKKYASECKQKAWKRSQKPLKEHRKTVGGFFEDIRKEASGDNRLNSLEKELDDLIDPPWSKIVSTARKVYFHARYKGYEAADEIKDWIDRQQATADRHYHTHLYSEHDSSALHVPVVPPEYSDDSEKVNGYEVLNKFFDIALDREDHLFAFGEDLGKIGDVNQGFAGMQDKYGKHRVADTGIREWSIVGQAIGMAMRGLRPIAEIQYLDYVVYGLTALTDDLATVRYRTDGTQMAPAIIRTRGHRLEGIWHAGSYLATLVHSLRGMHLIVPRNMVQAAGFYNTLLKSDDPGFIVEVLNGYRLKERLPDNLGDFTVPLGVPEVLRTGEDITVLTYGACVRIAQEAADALAGVGISVELIDAQTLLPFDLEHKVVESLKKTNRILFMDEDVPGGTTSYMMQQVLEDQGGYFYLDSPPLTLTSREHRPPYGSDGDYYSKPNAEDVFQTVSEVMRETNPARYPKL